MALYKPRGPVILRELDADLVPGVGFQICPDAVSISGSVDRWDHTNKCGLVDAKDDGGINDQSMSITMTFPTRTDKEVALAGLGVVVAAAGSPSVVTDEDLPSPIAIGGIYFLGGKNRNRNVTAVVLSSDGSPGGADLILNTDYTLDAETGKVVFLTAQSNVSAAYSHTNPKYISLMTAPQKEYAFDMEIYDRQKANQKGSLELYRVRFDPADGMDFMPDKEQSLTLKGECLLDTSREDSDELGQFGRMTSIE